MADETTRNQEISELFERLADKGAELSKRARVTASQLKTGEGNEFFTEMTFESVRDVEFWAAVLKAKFEEGNGHDA